LSYGDLYTLAGCVALANMSGPIITWTPGRQDAPNPTYCPPDGLLPQAEVTGDSHPNQTLTAGGVRTVFSRMGFTDNETVALIGAHSVGSCHAQNSGYSGSWTAAPFTWSNQFFINLLSDNWTYSNATSPKFQYDSGSLMMLPSDMSLRHDTNFLARAHAYATNESLFTADFAAAFTKLINLGLNQTGVFPPLPLRPRPPLRPFLPRPLLAD